jgi:threonine/homoserine/homoserine lactone efflux protein
VFSFERAGLISVFPLPTFLTFYAAVLAVQLSPGPDMLLVIGRGVGQGRRTAFMSAVGMTLIAGFVQILLLALGIASLVQASPFAFEILRWVGQLLLLGVVTKLSNFAILSIVALGAGTFGRWLARRPALIAWQERFAGVVMVGLGLRLALSGDVRSAR